MQQSVQGSQLKLWVTGTAPSSAGIPRSSSRRSLQGPHAPKAASAKQLETASSNGASANSTNPLDFDELTEIIRMVHDTDIVELELKSKKFSLAVRKKEAVEKPEPLYQALAAAPPAAPQAAAPAPAQAPPQAASPPQQQQGSPPPPPSASSPQASGNGGSSNAGTVEVASPMSGTFYHTPAPGEPPFVKVGDKVTKGQTIGIIEAMKLMNEIEADTAGTIVEFIASNAASVAPGQGLVRIQP